MASVFFILDLRILSHLGGSLYLQMLPTTHWKILTLSCVSFLNKRGSDSPGCKVIFPRLGHMACANARSTPVWTVEVSASPWRDIMDMR